MSWLHYLARDLARELVRELVYDLLWLNSIMLSRSQTWSQTCSQTWSQTWFPTCHRQVRAILTRPDSTLRYRRYINHLLTYLLTCRDSSNLVADRFRPYSTTLTCSLAGHRPVRDQIPLRCPACAKLTSCSQTCSRAGRKLDSVMEFGFYLHLEHERESSVRSENFVASEIVMRVYRL